MKRYVAVTNRTRGQSLGTRIGVADRWWPRLRGLVARPPLAAGEGLLLVPCAAVHTFGLRYPMDVAFVDAEGAVLAVYHRLAPGRWSRWHGRTAAALELPAGTLATTGTCPGDAIAWAPAWPTAGQRP